jgi:putative ATPase
MDSDALFALTEPGHDPPGSGVAGSNGAAARGPFGAVGKDAPLAVRMRPQVIDDLVGQGHLLAPGAPLRRLVSGGQMTSVILWGPPGTGKTTIAHLVARASDRRFAALCALNAGV